MRDVILHGSLGKRHGRKFELDVTSLVDAMRALGAQLPGFRKAINDGHFRVVVRRAGKDIFHVGEDEIGMRLPQGDLHVMPVVQGAKKGGIGKIIAGILIAAVSWWNPAGIFAASGVLGGAGITSGNAMIMGMGIAVAGLAQVLSASPQSDKKDAKNSDSFIFDGVTNTGEQGVAVPLIYGEIMVTDPTPLSAGMSTSKIPVGSSSGSSDSSLPGFGWNSAE